MNAIQAQLHFNPDEPDISNPARVPVPVILFKREEIPPLPPPALTPESRCGTPQPAQGSPSKDKHKHLPVHALHHGCPPKSTENGPSTVQRAIMTKRKVYLDMEDFHKGKFFAVLPQGLTKVSNP